MNYQVGQKLLHQYYGEVVFVREDLDTAQPVVALKNGVESIVTDSFLQPHQATIAKTPA